MALSLKWQPPSFRLALWNVLGWTIGPVHETGWLIPLGRKEGSMPAALSQGSHLSAQALCLSEWNVPPSAALSRVDGVSVSEDHAPTWEAERGMRRQLGLSAVLRRRALAHRHPLQTESPPHDLPLSRVSTQGRSIDSWAAARRADAPTQTHRLPTETRP